MSRPLSRSDKLITDMHLAALTALSEASGGQVRHGLGVSAAATHHLKRIDPDFFSDE